MTLEGVLQEDGDEFKEKAEEVRECLKVHMGAMSSNQIFKTVRGGRGFTLRVLKWMHQKGQISKDGAGWVLLP